MALIEQQRAMDLIDLVCKLILEKKEKKSAQGLVSPKDSFVLPAIVSFHTEKPTEGVSMMWRKRVLVWRKSSFVFYFLCRQTNVSKGGVSSPIAPHLASTFISDVFRFSGSLSLSHSLPPFFNSRYNTCSDYGLHGPHRASPWGRTDP